MNVLYHKMGEQRFSTRPAADLCQHLLVASCSLFKIMVPYSFNNASACWWLYAAFETLMIRSSQFGQDINLVVQNLQYAGI